MTESQPYPLLLAALADDGVRLSVLDAMPHHGWRVLTVGTRAEITGLLLQHQPDAVLIDPTMAETVVQFASLPIPRLALVAPDDPATMVRLLREQGISACLPLPFDSAVTAAALEALLRLTRPVAESLECISRPREGECSGSWTLTTTTWTLAVEGTPPVQLNQAETTFLSTLAAQPGNPVSRKQMITALGHNEEYFDSRRLDTLVSRLRTKVSKELGHCLPVRCIHSVGYAFVAPITIDA